MLESSEYTLDTLLMDAVNSGATDVHICTGAPPKMRIYGELKPMTYKSYAQAVILPVLNDIKSESLLKPLMDALARSRYESSGNWDMSYNIGNDARFRVNIFRQKGAIAGVFRILPTRILRAEKLGLPSEFFDLSKSRMPNSAKYYLECNDTTNSYTQYSVSPEGVLGDVPYERADNTQFMLYDWVTTLNQGYLLNQSQFADSTAERWFTLPESYSEKLLSRRVLYLDVFKPDIYDFKEAEPKQIDFGSGIVTMQMYKGKVHSKAVKEVLGYDSLGLYTALREEAKSKSDDNMLKLLDIYINDLNMDYTFSDQ